MECWGDQDCVGYEIGSVGSVGRLETILIFSSLISPVSPISISTDSSFENKRII